MSQRRPKEIPMSRKFNRNLINLQKFCRSAHQSTHPLQTARVLSIRKFVSLTNQNHSVANPSTALVLSLDFRKLAKKSPKFKKKSLRFLCHSRRCRTRRRGERALFLRNSLPRKREFWTTTLLGTARAWTQSSSKKGNPRL